MLTIEEIRDAIIFEQPKLHAHLAGRKIIVEGAYIISEMDVVAAPEGPITEFEIRMELSGHYPREEPKVFEVGGRIPRIPDRHINPGGDCCVTVWEHWLATASDQSVLSYINGPLHEYFLGQLCFEKTGLWPFGERAHGYEGFQEAVADALGVPNKKESLIYYLRLLSQGWPRGHWLCPCGSGVRLRHCHRDDMAAMQRRIAQPVARRMLKKMRGAHRR